MGFAKKLKNAYRRNRSVAAYCVFGVSIGGFVMSLALVSLPYRGLWLSEYAQDIRAELHAYHLAPSEPVRLRIPNAAVDAQFENPLGLDAEGKIEVPKSFATVARYAYAPTPGELGPAVILGHVDSFEGPAVLFNLRYLAPTDRIFIDRADGTTAQFEIVAIKQYAQDEFPTDEVYGDIPYAGLRLITCSGLYDHGALRYSHNLVVYARLVE